MLSKDSGYVDDVSGDEAQRIVRQSLDKRDPVSFASKVFAPFFNFPKGTFYRGFAERCAELSSKEIGVELLSVFGNEYDTGRLFWEDAIETFDASITFEVLMQNINHGRYVNTVVEEDRFSMDLDGGIVAIERYVVLNRGERVFSLLRVDDHLFYLKDEEDIFTMSNLYQISLMLGQANRFSVANTTAAEGFRKWAFYVADQIRGINDDVERVFEVDA